MKCSDRYSTATVNVEQGPNDKLTDISYGIQTVLNLIPNSFVVERSLSNLAGVCEL